MYHKAFVFTIRLKFAFVSMIYCVADSKAQFKFGACARQCDVLEFECNDRIPFKFGDPAMQQSISNCGEQKKKCYDGCDAKQDECNKINRTYFECLSHIGQLQFRSDEGRVRMIEDCKLNIMRKAPNFCDFSPID